MNGGQSRCSEFKYFDLVTDFLEGGGSEDSSANIVRFWMVLGRIFCCISMSLSISITNRFSIDICVLISEILLVEEGSKMSHDREGQLNS